MYWYEEKLRAVELCIKLGKRVKADIRQLVYPTENALKGRCREHDRQMLDRILEFTGQRPRRRIGREQPVGMKFKPAGQAVALE
jgi:hypothetical protein